MSTQLSHSLFCGWLSSSPTHCSRTSLSGGSGEGGKGEESPPPGASGSETAVLAGSNPEAAQAPSDQDRTAGDCVRGVVLQDVTVRGEGACLPPPVVNVTVASAAVEVEWRVRGVRCAARDDRLAPPPLLFLLPVPCYRWGSTPPPHTPSTCS